MRLHWTSTAASPRMCRNLLTTLSDAPEEHTGTYIHWQASQDEGAQSSLPLTLKLPTSNPVSPTSDPVSPTTPNYADANLVKEAYPQYVPVIHEKECRLEFLVSESTNFSLAELNELWRHYDQLHRRAVELSALIGEHHSVWLPLRRTHSTYSTSKEQIASRTIEMHLRAEDLADKHGGSVAQNIEAAYSKRDDHLPSPKSNKLIREQLFELPPVHTPNSLASPSSLTAATSLLTSCKIVKNHSPMESGEEYTDDDDPPSLVDSDFGSLPPLVASSPEEATKPANPCGKRKRIEQTN